MNTRKSDRSNFFRLETLFVLAAIVLLFQIFPALWSTALSAIDIRNWPRTLWFNVSWLVLLVLVAIRFGPDLYTSWRAQRDRRASERTKKQKRQDLKEQRETLQRIKEGRKRRVY